MLTLLLALQAFHVAFLMLHDWLPLGSLNNVAAVRREDPGKTLWLTTVISTLPFALGLFWSLQYAATGLPHWVIVYLWVAYVLLFFGELQAWWIPYFFGARPERVMRYSRMFDGTHAFLPTRNALVPNTLHVALHLCTVTMLIVLALFR